MQRIAILEQHAGAVHGRGHRGRGEREHRHLLVERLDDRHAEALVLAGTQEQIGDVVEGDQLLVGDVADEVHVAGAEPADQLVERSEVALEPALRADQQQARPRVEDRVVGVEPADHVLDLLVGDHPADEDDVGPLVVEVARDQPVRLAVEVAEVGHHRQHRGAGEAERLEILAVELGVAHRQVAAVGVGLQLAAAAERLPRQGAVDADEVLGRRDVVVDQRHSIRQRVRRPRRLRPEREVVQQQVVAAAEVDQLAVVARLRLEPVIRRLDENLRLVAGGAEHALDAEHLVADGVAIAQRGEHLVDPDHPCLPAGPFGSLAMTSSAAGRSWRRRSNQPGSGSVVAAGVSCFSRANISRYFRSITGQS